MKQAVSSDLLLYADDSCFVFQHKHVTEIKTNLNNDLCEWFLNNKKASILEKKKLHPFRLGQNAN